MSGYRSIFLEPDWAHAIYYGWSEVANLPGLRLLRKRMGPAVRNLLLAEAVDEAALRPALALCRSRAALFSETVIHDFTGTLATSGHLPGFAALGRGRWLLNEATFVIDLTSDPDALLSRMVPDTRRRIRKADQARVPLTVERKPNPERMGRFFLALNELHRDRGLHAISALTMRQMFEDGRATLLSNEASNGAGAYLMVYHAGDKAIWLHGVGRGTSPDSGQYLQWRAIETLKAEGLRWYDLGGVPPDPQAGIHRYKQGFGGELVRLGTEVLSSTPLMSLARRTVSALRRHPA